MIVVVAAVKGGVGKTTLAVGLAETLSAASGRPALLLDLDPQGSATRWAEQTTLVSRVVPLVARSAGQLPRLIRAEVAGEPWVVIDTPPGDIAVVDAAIGEADVVLIPTKPTALDLPQTVETWRMASSDVPTVAVLNQVQPSTRQAPLATRDALASAGVGVLAGEIRQWQSIAQLSLSEWPPEERVKIVFTRLAEELLEVVG